MALRLAPLRLRMPLFYRVFARRAALREELFDNAHLALAPHVSLTLSPTDVSHQPIALTGVYELDVSRLIVDLARAGGLLVDVGANFGYYSCLWAGTHEGNRVVAFEPVPKNAAALRANIERNQMADRVMIDQSAVGRETGTVPFQAGPPGQTGQGGFAATNDPADLTVPVCTLDDFFAPRGDTIAVLKIDTEGADAWVLEGARRLLGDHRIRHVFFEQLASRMQALNVPENAPHLLLQRCGYRLRRLNAEQWHAFLPP